MFIADKVLRKVLYLRRTKMESKKKKKKSNDRHRCVVAKNRDRFH